MPGPGDAIDQGSPIRGRKRILGHPGDSSKEAHPARPRSTVPSVDSVRHLDSESQNLNPNTVSEDVLASAIQMSTTPSSNLHNYATLAERGDNSDSEVDLTPRNTAQKTSYDVLASEDAWGNGRQSDVGSRHIPTALKISDVTASSSQKAMVTRPKDLVTAFNESEFSSSVDSFHSMLSWHSPIPPPSPPVSTPSSPAVVYPYPHDDIALPEQQCRDKDASERTVTPSSSRVWGRIRTYSTGSSRSSASQGASMNDHPDEKSANEESAAVIRPESQTSPRYKTTTMTGSRRRTLSPLPSAVNLFSPPRHGSHFQNARHLPTAIVQKTCEILLSPPSHLFHLMIRVASRIAAGEWRGFLYGPGEPFHWDVSEDEYVGEEWFEDDFGVNLEAPRASSTSSITRRSNGGSWEID